MSTSRFLLALTASLALATFVWASDEPTLEQRLEKLAESLETAREHAHIPGMSIAIVKDDQVVWARGFGLADVAAERPADEGTIYAIGSTTKAFTATLIGMLADEGKASWDDPVTKYLPYFDLQVRSDDENAQCTLRDLLNERAKVSATFFAQKQEAEEAIRAAGEKWTAEWDAQRRKLEDQFVQNRETIEGETAGNFARVKRAYESASTKAKQELSLQINRINEKERKRNELAAEKLKDKYAPLYDRSSEFTSEIDSPKAAAFCW